MSWKILGHGWGYLSTYYFWWPIPRVSILRVVVLLGGFVGNGCPEAEIMFLYVW